MDAPASATPIAVVGTGTMGQGIAQVALVAGHPVLLHDAIPGRAAQAAEAVLARLDRLVEKGRMAAAQRDLARSRITAVGELAELAEAALVIEAVAEQLAAKQRLFAALEEAVGDGCVLATNTSSLSVTAVAGGLRRPGRLVGLHFFNPAPLLPLVEVVSGHATEEAVARFACETAAAWGKTPVRCTDTPGFIVNRVARPFYAEAFRTLEEGVADPATIDAVVRDCGGFAMGPFELTDLIGQDVNEAVTRSVWESFFQDPKFTPSLAQRRLVEAGRLGRKSGRGWFRYGTADRPGPSTAEAAKPPQAVAFRGGPAPVLALADLIEQAGVPVRRVPDPDGRGGFELPGGGRLVLTGGALPAPGEVHFDLALDYRAATRVAVMAGQGTDPAVLEQAVGLFQALGKQVSVIGPVPGMIVARTVAMLVDFAHDAAARGVAGAEDIDTAMRLGVNYPRGPLEWGEVLGADWVYRLLRAVHAVWPTGRYAPCLALSRRAAVEPGVLSS